MSDDAAPSDLRLWANQVTNAHSYVDAVNGPTFSTKDHAARKYADNNLPKRSCSVFFKIAASELNIGTLVQDLSKIGILSSSLRCLQKVSGGGYVGTFSNASDRQIFASKSSTVVRPQREIVTVYVHDAPFELPDKALKHRLESYGEVLRITRGRYSDCVDVETGIRCVKMHIDTAIPSFIRFGCRLVRTLYDGQVRTCRRCNLPGHQARECKEKICFNCDHVGHEAPDCEKDILCSICKDPSHLA